MTKEMVLEQESRLVFDQFTHADAWAIAEEILAVIQRGGFDPVRIRVTYRENLVLSYLMDGKDDSLWPVRKEKTVIASGHSSLYTFLEMENNEAYKQWMADESYAVCGGGFPIKEAGVVVGAICVSGLEHTLDHQVIIDALNNYLKVS
ncbi:MAG: heme-binding protein [Turicibacter sp.]|nr:heme-binding protein [Turicibacter sp.]